MRATVFQSPAALQASSRWYARISSGIAKPPRCFSRRARLRRPAKSSPTQAWRARFNRSPKTGGRAFTKGRLPPRWRASTRTIADCSGPRSLADVPVERLISKQYAAARGRLIDARSALKWDTVPSFGSLSGDTVYVAAVDRDGNAASLIQSLYSAFGACMVAGSTGVILQNRGAYFSLDRNHPNRLEPGKIPLHTL